MGSKIIQTNISKKQASDSGMAATLILLALGLIIKEPILCKIAIPVLLLNMIAPMLYYPFAVFWFSLSNLIGFISSKVILTVVFFLLVTPVALLRKMLGKDSLSLKMFKKGRESVLKDRYTEFTPNIIEKPY